MKKLSFFHTPFFLTFTYRYNDTYMLNIQTELVGFEPTCPGGLTHFECAPL